MAQCLRLTEVLSELRSRFQLEHFRDKKKEDGKRVCLDQFFVALAAYHRPVADHSYTPQDIYIYVPGGCSEVLGPLIIWWDMNAQHLYHVSRDDLMLILIGGGKGGPKS